MSLCGTPPVVGILLAAGCGVRYGGPKALVKDWLADSVHVLSAGGCAEIIVVLGAASNQARRLIPSGATIVIPTDWAEGMGASLRAGLDAAQPTSAEAAVVHLVDLPGVGPEVVHRLVVVAGPSVLARVTYRGAPGHPVLLGREHWPGVVATARGDLGAREYLRTREIDQIECGDVAEGDDVDVRSR